MIMFLSLIAAKLSYLFPFGILVTKLSHESKLDRGYLEQLKTGAEKVTAMVT